MDRDELGKAFPLKWAGKNGDIRPMLHCGSFLDAKNLNLIVDTGNAHDGDFETPLFRREVKNHILRVEANTLDGNPPRRAWLPRCVWNGEAYTNLLVGSGVNSMGLRFLARHLVTLDFPKRTMYLKKLTSDALPDEIMLEADQFLKNLGKRGTLPGWSTDDDAVINLEAHPDSETYDFRKHYESVDFHYRITRSSRASPWKLQKMWRTDQRHHLIEE